eukprot:365998-Chlamydomonas_euryale.AAC.13
MGVAAAGTPIGGSASGPAPDANPTPQTLSAHAENVCPVPQASPAQPSRRQAITSCTNTCHGEKRSGAAAETPGGGAKDAVE